MKRADHRADQVNGLLAKAAGMGITKEILAPIVDRLLAATAKDGAEVKALQRLADTVNRRGLKDQLNYLYDVIGYRRSEEELNGLNALDNFIKRVNAKDPS
jgi:hypothetical protein